MAKTMRHKGQEKGNIIVSKELGRQGDLTVAGH